MIKNNELDFMHLAISEARKSQHKPNCNRSTLRSELWP